MNFGKVIDEVMEGQDLTLREVGDLIALFEEEAKPLIERGDEAYEELEELFSDIFGLEPDFLIDVLYHVDEAGRPKEFVT